MKPVGEPDARNGHVRLCDQEMQVCTVGDRPTEVKVRSLVAWIAGRREIEFPKPIDKTIFRMVSKSSGRNESERRCGLESEKPQGLSFHSGGVEATARWQGHAKQLERPSSSRREIGGAENRITGNTGKSMEDERELEGSIVSMKRGNARGERGPCCLQWLEQHGRQG